MVRHGISFFPCFLSFSGAKDAHRIALVVPLVGSQYDILSGYFSERAVNEICFLKS